MRKIKIFFFTLLALLVAFAKICSMKYDEKPVAGSELPLVERLEGSLYAKDDECAEESFISLQDEYEKLNQEYNEVLEYYTDAEGMEQNKDIEDALNSAYEYLEIVNGLNREEITETDATLIVESMAQVGDSLDSIAASMGLIRE